MQRAFERHSGIISFRFGDSLRQFRGLLGDAAPSRGRLCQILSELLKRLEDNLPFDHVGIGLHNPALNVVSVILQAGAQGFSPEIPILENSLGLVLNGKAIEVVDAETDTGFSDLVNRARSRGFRSFRVVPLSTESKTLGALAVVRKQPGPFSPEESSYLDYAAQSFAFVLENSLMAHALGHEKEQLQTLLEINNALVSSLDLEKLLQQVSDSIRRIVQHDYTYLSLYDKNFDQMRVYALDVTTQPATSLPEMTAPMSDCPSGIACRQGKSMIFTEPELRAIDSEYMRRFLQLGVRSIGCFLLENRGRKLGVIGFLSRQDVPQFEEEILLLNQIARPVAVAVDNALAYEEIAGFKEKAAKEKLYFEEEIRAEHNFGEVVGNSSSLKHVLKQVEIAAPSDATVLILGETGTGKELIARAVHRLSSRRNGNFIKLNCAAIPTGLLESELFGHEKGAFTGAISQKVGRLELADRGTLFLDEIGEIPPELQPKLLRVLQDQEFERLGGIRTIKVNVRVIAATNRDLAQAVEDRQFRSDLYYRLNVFPIRVPPLRERKDDIAMLVRYFVHKFARRMGKNIQSVPSEITRELERWHWPGNVRELENFIERSVILSPGEVFFAPIAELQTPSSGGSSTRSTLEDVEREYILRTLRESGGVIAGVRGAAARLGMKRTTLQSRMQKLGITREEYET